MARAKVIKGTTQSDIVRGYLKANPSATVQQIMDDLKSHGISKATAQKIKYRDGRRSRRTARNGAARTNAAPAMPAGEERKADSIRRVAGGMTGRIRPRDVIAALGEEGIKVGFAQVGQVLRNMRKSRRQSARGTAGGRNTRAAHTGTTISLEALFAAKKLADQLGGIQAAKQAVDALAKIV